MDVHHKVASGCVLHDETHMLRCLETGKQVDKERMVGQVHDLEDPLLAHETAAGGRKYIYVYVRAVT